MKSTKKRCVCIIGARKGSRRLPEKNRLLLGGKPLYMLTLEAALGAGVFDHILFTTDDEAIISELDGALNIFLDRRPVEFAGDVVSMLDVISYLLEKHAGMFEGCEDLCVLTPCTPFRKSRHIREAHRLYKQRRATSLVSLTEFPCPPELRLELENGWVRRKWEGLTRPGEYKKQYYPNGAVTFVNFDCFVRLRAFYTPDTAGYTMIWPDGLDIDDEADFAIARKLVEGCGWSGGLGN